VCRVTALGAERDLTRQPVQGAGGAYAGFVEARHRGGGRQTADGRLDRLQSSGAGGLEVGERALAEAFAGEEVAHDLGEPVEGQQLILAQIHGHALDARPVLDGRRGLGRKHGAVDTATRASFDFALVFGDLQLRLGQVEDLAAIHAVRRQVGQGSPATHATLDRMPDGMVRLVHHAQRVARMAWLAAGGPFAGLAQTLGFGFSEAV